MKFIKRKNIANDGVEVDAYIDPIKNKIKIFVGIILMVLLSGGIGAYADYKYRATEIKYTDEKSVAQALNELYAIKKDYILPSGTKTVTEKSNQIDVGSYKYIDTTGLYTKNEMQSGEGTYWTKKEITIPATSSYQYNFGYHPSTVLIEGVINTTTYRWFTTDSGAVMYYASASFDGTYNHGMTTSFDLSGSVLTFTHSSSWNNQKLTIYTIK